ncbi:MULTISPECIES: hypothetical protein [unclassified Streptomyces]|uniref:hypothetical protein n=1 Tax=unclassified Streptomyces TaxID=2593676 RepID=UPI001F08319E|nr:hypothetical protein [Streptomyces sp. CB09001]
METDAYSLLPLRAVADVRAALTADLGFPGDKESFESDVQRALEGSSEADLAAVATVVVDYRGRIRLRQDPDFETSVQEGIDLTMRLKREARGGSAITSEVLRQPTERGGSAGGT